MEVDSVDTTESTEVTESKPQLDEVKLSELIKKGMKDSFDELRNSQGNAQQNNQSPQTQSTDPWDEVLEPRIRKGTQQSNSIAAAAEDKVDFYTSDYWLKEIDDILPGDNTTEEGNIVLNKAKKEIRETLETTFSNLLKQGRGIPRSDIIDFAVGQYVKKNKSTYTE